MLRVSRFWTYETRVLYISQERSTYLKSIGKSKALATTLSNIEPEDDSNNEDDGILNVFTAIVNPIEQKKEKRRV